MNLHHWSTWADLVPNTGRVDAPGAGAGGSRAATARSPPGGGRSAPIGPPVREAALGAEGVRAEEATFVVLDFRFRRNDVRGGFPLEPGPDSDPGRDDV